MSKKKVDFQKLSAGRKKNRMFNEQSEKHRKK